MINLCLWRLDLTFENKQHLFSDNPEENWITGNHRCMVIYKNIQCRGEVKRKVLTILFPGPAVFACMSLHVSMIFFSQLDVKICWVFCIALKFTSQDINQIIEYANTMLSRNLSMILALSLTPWNQCASQFHHRKSLWDQDVC